MRKGFKNVFLSDSKWGKKNDRDYIVEYDKIRYLECLNNEELIERYERTVFCSRFYDEYKHNSFFERKKIHFKQEFFLRDITLPILTTGRIETGDSLNFRLYKFGKKEYMNAFLKGKIRFNASAIYDKDDLNDARKDNELSKEVILNGKYFSINEQPCLGKMKFTTKLINDQFILCLSAGNCHELRTKFGENSYVQINDVRAFLNRIKKAALFHYGFSRRMITYYDKYEFVDLFFPIVYKDYVYSYQKEFRICLIPIENLHSQLTIELDIGNLEDIASIVFV